MVSCDPNFASVALLVLGNSAAGSTAFVDSSTYALTLTGGGTTQATAANQLFGLNTISVGNTLLSTPIAASGPLDLGALGVNGTWTIECWIFGVRQTALFMAAGNLTTQGFLVQAISSGELQAQVFYTAGGSQTFNTTTNLMVASAWNHVAIVCNAGILTLFLNGIAGPSASTTGRTAATWSVGSFDIGGSTSATQWVGQLAEVRVTTGIARYTASFTPPTAAFPTINCTQSVPNLVGDTATQAIAANAAAGYVTTVQEANHPTVPAGIVISQQPPAGTLSVLGTNVILQLSVGPVTTAGMGGDVWGSTGGGNIQAQGQTPIGQALAYATQRDNAIVQASQSVLAALATGAVNPTSVVATNQSTPAINIPTTPTVG